MRLLLVILGALVVLATVPAAGAEGTLLLNESTSHIDISENFGQVKITLNYVVSQAGENAIRDLIYVYGTISNVSVYDSSGALPHFENIEGGFTVISFDLRETLIAGDRSTVYVEFTKPTATTGGSYRYEIRYLWKTVPVSSQVIAALPSEYTLYGMSENASSTSISDGKLQLRWSRVQENQFFTAITFGKQSTVSDNQAETTPVETSSTNILLLLTAAISLAVVGTFLKIRTLKSKAKAPQGVKRPRGLHREDVRKIIGMLTTHEKKVVAVLLKKDNLTQRVLCDRTGIPKATMSRVLQRLENKGIVAREGFGASKRVMLTRWSKRWKVG